MLPPEGWTAPDDRGRITYTKHAAAFMDRPPVREGYRVYFVGRHGLRYTTWTYRPEPSDPSQQ